MWERVKQERVMASSSDLILRIWDLKTVKKKAFIQAQTGTHECEHTVFPVKPVGRERWNGVCNANSFCNLHMYLIVLRCAVRVNVLGGI